MNGRSSALLHAGIRNATFNLERVIPDYAAGKLTEPHHPHAVGVLFRKRGVCRMLTTGVAEPLFVAQMQAVGAYLHRLPSMPEDHKVTSRAAVFWDAIGGGYWEAAGEISKLSRATINRTWEHEDDFLYVWFLMTRYFRDVPAESDRAAVGQAELRQQALLDRWDVVLQGGSDPRRALCEALLHRDAEGFRVAFDEVADHREARLLRELGEGRLPQDDAAWTLPFWAEGLALIRLAERDGFVADRHSKGLPETVRVASPFACNRNAWQRIDIIPRALAGPTGLPSS